MKFIDGLKSRMPLPARFALRLPALPASVATMVAAVALLLVSIGYIVVIGGHAEIRGPWFGMAMPRTAPHPQALITPRQPASPAGQPGPATSSESTSSDGAAEMPGAQGKPPSFAALPELPLAEPLPDAPQAGLFRSTPKGNLPTVAADGRTAATAYARPFTGEPGRPRLAVVVAGLGLDPEATRAAISRLPPEVTLAFSPYAANLDGWIKEARAAGHEVLLGLPLEPMLFPAHDNGPLSLGAGMSVPAALDRLESILGAASGYVGLLGSFRAPLANSETMTAVLGTVKDSGLLYVGDTVPARRPTDLPIAMVTTVADDEPFRSAVDARLSEAATVARRQGAAVAVIHPLPVSFERASLWIERLRNDGIEAAPVSAVALGGRRG